MKISVVTVALNAATTIGDTLRSVRAQERVQVEHIVIDGGSTDGTLELARSHAANPDLVRSGRDAGVYDAMNKGLALATGEYVGFLNADDYFTSPASLASLLEGGAREKIQCIFGDIDLVRADETRAVVRRWRTGPFSPLRARLGWQAPHSAFYARRECFEQWGGFDASMRIAADYEVALRFLLKHSASWVYNPVCVAHMRMGGRSTRSLAGIIEGNREVGRAWKMNGLRGGFLVPFVKPLTKLAQLRPGRGTARG